MHNDVCEPLPLQHNWQDRLCTVRFSPGLSRKAENVVADLAPQITRRSLSNEVAMQMILVHYHLLFLILQSSSFSKLTCLTCFEVRTFYFGSWPNWRLGTIFSLHIPNQASICCGLRLLISTSIEPGKKSLICHLLFWRGMRTILKQSSAQPHRFEGAS